MRWEISSLLREEVMLIDLVTSQKCLTELTEVGILVLSLNAAVFENVTGAAN